MRLSEIYTSVQGEGPNTGLPIQFVRFGGCNMRCPGWPCDTQFAVDPQYKSQWEVVPPGEILSRLPLYPQRVCITGGEPLTQRSSEMETFAKGLLYNGYKIDLFTNGSQTLPPWIHSRDVTVVMDWKLAGSGEADTEVPIRIANAGELQRKDAIKFVVCNEFDLEQAQAVTKQLDKKSCQASLWVGAAWGRITDEEVIEFINEHHLPWRLNVQVHKHIWTPDLRGV